MVGGQRWVVDSSPWGGDHGCEGLRNKWAVWFRPGKMKGVPIVGGGSTPPHQAFQQPWGGVVAFLPAASPCGNDGFGG